MKWTDFRENAEAITVALLLALLIRHFVLESYEIPTGSMAPYLHGLNSRIACPNCGVDTPVGISSDSLTNRVQMGDRYRILDGVCKKNGTPFKIQAGTGNEFICPGCKETRSVSEVTIRTAIAKSLRVECRECTYKHETLVEPDDILGGNKILVEKFSYDVVEPNRWDVVVFRFNSQRNYIKRLIGLPGEQVQIVNGDIHIDGEVELKPVDVQKHLWIPIHDSLIAEAGLEEPAWSQDRGWTRYTEETADTPEKTAGGWGVNLSTGSGELRYVRPIRNYYGYNGSYRGKQPAPVRDLKVLARISAMPTSGGKSSIAIEIDNSPSTYRWEIPFSSGESRFLITGNESEEDQPGWTSDSFALVPDRETALSMEVIDRHVRLFSDEQLVAQIALPESELSAGLKSATGQTIRLQMNRCGGYVHQVQVFRDLHWTGNGNHAVTGPFQIDQGRYFVLGDNSPSSLDSRYWGSFSRSNLLGRGFVIFWPALPWRNESGFIR